MADSITKDSAITVIAAQGARHRPSYLRTGVVQFRAQSYPIDLRSHRESPHLHVLQTLVCPDLHHLKKMLMLGQSLATHPHRSCYQSPHLIGWHLDIVNQGAATTWLVSWSRCWKLLPRHSLPGCCIRSFQSYHWSVLYNIAHGSVLRHYHYRFHEFCFAFFAIMFIILVWVIVSVCC